MPQEAPQPLPSSAPAQISPPKRKRWKFIVAFLGIILLSFVAFVGVAIFEQWRGERAVERLAEALRQAEQDIYQKQLADTIGGKTPQETLRLYIEAVEKNDYELASKYWEIDKQRKELESLTNAPHENISNFVSTLKKLELVDWKESLSKMYETDSRQYNLSESKEDYIERLYGVWNYDRKALMSTKVDGYDFSVSFFKYPNDIWKISEM